MYGNTTTDAGPQGIMEACLRDEMEPEVNIESTQRVDPVFPLGLAGYLRVPASQGTDKKLYSSFHNLTVELL
jgi:hypothetical protein